jgi:hypothetical protein
MTSGAWNERSLVAWIPLQAGQCVAVAGACPPLVDALRGAGAQVWQCHGTAELADGGQHAVDHLMAPDLRAVPDLLRPDVIRHAVRPGGTVLIGTQHRRGRPSRAAAHSTRSLHAALTRCGVGRIDVFAVRQSLSNPRAIVPVDDRILRWYVTTGFLPLSRLESILASGLSVLRPGRVALALFPALMALGEVIGDP